jgi:hypothetical protein
MLFGLAAFAVPALANDDSATTLPLGGVMSARPGLLERWCWSGAWRYPVGAALDFREPGGPGETGYHVSRNIGGPDEGTSTHQGADIVCGHGGGPVRAAADGLVLLANRSGWNSGYGRIVVLGHRLEDGTGVYTVYAHLAPGSIRVHPGQMVAAGTRLGRVGRSGRATTPHLHFEVRLPESPIARWENARVLDPIAFVAGRLAAPGGSDSLGGHLGWAQCAALLDPGAVVDVPLLHERWWRMLAASGRHRLTSIPVPAAELRDSLIETGVLPSESSESADAPVHWKEFELELRRLREIGLRLPPRGISTAAHRALCREALGVGDPGRSPSRIAHRGDGPTTSTAVLALADLAPEMVAERSHRPVHAKSAPKRAKPPVNPEPAVDSTTSR